MIKRLAICVAAVFCTLLFVFVGLVLVASFCAQGGASCQLASGRQISCTATGIYVSLETHKDTAIVRTLRHTVSVLPTQLQVDGRRVVAIPASTKSVEIKVEGCSVTLIADGETVGSVRR